MTPRHRVFLLESATGRAVDAAVVSPLTEKHLEDWRDLWRTHQTEALRRLSRSGILPISGRAQHGHWSWEQKEAAIRGVLAYQGYAVEARGVTQGMMIVDLTGECRLPEQAGKPLIYVLFVESAPWNRPQFGQLPIFQGVGSILLGTAINLSHDEGFGGRLGLHSLPQADSFYRDKLGMTELGPDISKQNLRYFEMTPGQANDFAARTRRV
jgi:hypothetical protein